MTYKTRVLAVVLAVLVCQATRAQTITLFTTKDDWSQWVNSLTAVGPLPPRRARSATRTVR